MLTASRDQTCFLRLFHSSAWYVSLQTSSSNVFSPVIFDIAFHSNTAPPWPAPSQTFSTSLCNASEPLGPSSTCHVRRIGQHGRRQQRAVSQMMTLLAALSGLSQAQRAASRSGWGDKSRTPSKPSLLSVSVQACLSNHTLVTRKMSLGVRGHAESLPGLPRRCRVPAGPARASLAPLSSHDVARLHHEMDRRVSLRARSPRPGDSHDSQQQQQQHHHQQQWPIRSGLSGTTRRGQRG